MRANRQARICDSNVELQCDGRAEGNAPRRARYRFQPPNLS